MVGGGGGGENKNLVEVIFLVGGRGGWRISTFLAGEGGTPQYRKLCDELFLGLHDPP